MESGEEHKNVIVNPENYEEMVKKHQERDEELLKKVLARKKVETIEELKALSQKAIVTRATRADQKLLKDRTIQRESSSTDIQELRKRLNEEINAIATQTLKELPPNLQASLENKVSGNLKGRIKENPAPQKRET